MRRVLVYPPRQPNHALNTSIILKAEGKALVILIIRTNRGGADMMNTVNIQPNLVTVNPFSRPGNALRSVQGIVIHWVGNAGSSARANRNYFESLKGQSLSDPVARYASAHFIVGINGEIIQCIPVEEMAYHVGAKRYTTEARGRLGPYPNNCTLGIELCHPDASGQFTEATQESAVHLCALLCTQYGLDPVQSLWTHHGITGKYCPKYFVDVPGAFERFKTDVGSSHA